MSQPNEVSTKSEDSEDVTITNNIKKQRLNDQDDEKGLFQNFIVETDPDSKVVTSLSSRHLHDTDRLQICPSFEPYQQSLVTLDLYKYRYIETLHESVVHLTHLKSLQLVRCTRLQSLPSTIGNLTNLESLDLTDSPNIASLPESIGNLKR